MFRTDMLSKTCRVLYQNKKRCISLAFIIRLEDYLNVLNKRDKITFPVNAVCVFF